MIMEFRELTPIMYLCMAMIGRSSPRSDLLIGARVARVVPEVYQRDMLFFLSRSYTDFNGTRQLEEARL
jgi:hypothetical protein